jgi:hypothetical protein
MTYSFSILNESLIETKVERVIKYREESLSASVRSHKDSEY